MLLAAQISSLLFHAGVALAAIIPRLPNDPPFPFAIGGDLSYNFRRVMLALVTSNAIRVIFFEDSRFVEGTTSTLFVRMNTFIILRALESFLVSFLCLLTPYLMQCQLQNRINISQPARELMMWVYIDVAISVLACIMVEVHGSFWGIKKLGDAITFVPVYKTLKLYNSIATRGGLYPGRGDISAQSLMTMEYFVLISTLLAAFGYFHMNHSHPIIQAFRYLGSYAQLTRLLCHAMLMNARDEANYFSKFATTTDKEESIYETPTTLATIDVARSA